VRHAPKVEYAIYRVAQEALNNLARHANVPTARLELQCSPDELVITVSDRGPGFQSDETGGRAGQGLLNMRHRAAEIGADLTIHSTSGQGTIVRLWVPLALTLLEAAK
jgi:signal transduction histidine kinase